MKRLVVLDIDDTLFDWLTMWSTSFKLFVDAVAVSARIPTDVCKRRLRSFHQSAGTSEYPYAPAELEALFPEILPEQARELSRLLVTSRESRHTLLPGIRDLLQDLATNGDEIVLHTDAPPALAVSRVSRLGLESLATAVYSTTSRLFAEVLRSTPPGEYHRVLTDRKPNPEALRTILRRHGGTEGDSIYVGDSLYRDVAMAQACHVPDVHARYSVGAPKDNDAYDLLREVSHWKEEDVVAEKVAQSERLIVATRTASTVEELSALLLA